MRQITIQELLTSYLPGSRDQPWSWNDEARNILTHICVCCGQPGHYQQGIVSRMRDEGEWWADDPVLAPVLGNDGTVWDGHHRIVGAISLRWELLTVDDAIWPDLELV